jgi:serine/threonine protein kinase
MMTWELGHALIIGIGADLSNTVTDAVGLQKILQDPSRCAYPPQQVHLLTAANAHREHILAALDQLAQTTDAQSTVIVYFSGHGYRVMTPTGDSYYLLSYGYDMNRLPQTAISGATFTARLQAIPAQKLLVLLDCCHAGGIDIPKTPGLRLTKSPMPPEALTLLAEGRGRVLVASSRERELSFAGRPYSAFTLALMEALSGIGVAKQDGYVRVADLALHAREVVPTRTRGQQHPMLHFEQADNFVLAYYAGGDTQPKGLPFTDTPEIEPTPGAWTSGSAQPSSNLQEAQAGDSPDTSSAPSYQITINRDMQGQIAFGNGNTLVQNIGTSQTSGERARPFTTTAEPQNLPRPSEQVDAVVVPHQKAANGQDPWIGRQLGAYTILNRIGQGGGGIVYRAYHPTLRRYAAVKVLPADRGVDASLDQRFMREARAIAHLRHPHIVQLYDFDTYEGGYYMILEFVEGESLQARLARLHAAGERLPHPEVRRITAQIADALAYVHSQGLVHRDIKPANILLTPTGDAVLTDFGIVRWLTETRMTTTGIALGTPTYIAPEQAQGKPVDHRADLYALAVMLYEMLAGRPPFLADDAMALLFKHIQESVPPLHQFVSRSPSGDVPQAVERELRKALCKDPEYRHRDATAFREAFEQAWEITDSPVWKTGMNLQ